MRPWMYAALSLINLYPQLSQAATEADCSRYEDYLSKSCKNKPLEDVTIVTAGQFIVAKLQCHGCPVVTYPNHDRREKHQITYDEENALFFNITLSHAHTELLLNDIAIFPTLTFPPPHPIIAGQVPLNMTYANLGNSIWCTRQRCRNFAGKCWCIYPSDSSQALSFDYGVEGQDGHEGRDKIWEISFDAIGGFDGYLDDAPTVFNSSQQQKLKIIVEQKKKQKEARNQTLRIISVQLIPRSHTPNPTSPHRPFLERMKFFLGVTVDEGNVPGHLIYWQQDWDWFGRKETLGHALREAWEAFPLFLVSVIIGSILGALLLGYGIYRFVLLERAEWEVKIRMGMGADGRSEERGWKETEGLLDGEGVYRDDEEVVVEETDRPLDLNRALPPEPVGGID